MFNQQNRSLNHNLLQLSQLLNLNQILLNQHQLLLFKNLLLFMRKNQKDQLKEKDLKKQHRLPQKDQKEQFLLWKLNLSQFQS